MKTKNLIERLSLFLLALVLTMPAWAQGNNGIEVVSIGSKEDWKAFCQRVNHNGEPFLNAKLTQDVDLGGEIVMLGSVSYPYSGTFDGQGHTLKFNWNAGEDNQIAPFYYVENATIKNLRTQGKITTKGYNLSGMVCAALGTTTITGCISDVDITGGDGGLASSNAAGMVQAVAYGASVQITDCLVKGSITDNADESDRAMAGFVFYNGGTYTLTRCLYVGKNNAANNGLCKTFGTESGYGFTFTDCYYLNTCGKAQGEQVTAERLKSGEMAYLLQNKRTENVWGQTLGTDLEPLPTAEATKRVYEVKFVYNGEVKATRYATNGQSIHGGLPTAQDLLDTGYNPKLTYALNFGDFTATTPVTEDKSVDVTVAVSGTFDIASKDDWKVFCDIVNNGVTRVDAKLTADVNLDLDGDFMKVGTSINQYEGTFDGQGHTLSFDWTSQGGLAPFYFVDGATIKNLRTKGKITTSGSEASGLLGNAYGTTTITGCVSDVEITSSIDWGACKAAGLVQTVGYNGKVTVTDCVVKGRITATTNEGRKGMAGFVYTLDDGGACTLINCLYTGTNNGIKKPSSNYTFAPAGVTLKNCYYLHVCGKPQGTMIWHDEELLFGEVAKQLQGSRADRCYWAQTLGDGPTPYFDIDKGNTNYVYYDTTAAKWVCDDFRLTEGKSLYLGLNFTAANITYNRTVGSVGMTTLCLPYDLPVGELKVYTLSDVQNSVDKVYFKEVKGTLEAYKPYLIVANGQVNFGGQNIEVKTYEEETLPEISAGRYTFTSAIYDISNPIAVYHHAYILQSDGKFHKVKLDTPNALIPPFHAFISFKNAQPGKAFSIAFDGETTGINNVTNEATDGKNGPVYDLQGRRVADRLDDVTRHSLPAGVYIVGGRKVIVK